MLEISDISLIKSQKTLLNQITLRFRPGTLYGLLGPNGSGKSSLLKAIANIWRPTTGEVCYFGQDLHSMPRRQLSRIVTLVPQNPPLLFSYTVLEMVEMGLYPLGVIPPPDLVKWAMELTDILPLKERSIAHLSQGERQRVYIARALLTGSAILLLDEPCASLDIKHQLEIWKLLHSLKSRERIIIVANHDLAATARHTDEIAVMHQGKCLGQGSYQTMLTEELLGEVFGVSSSHATPFALL